MGQEALYHNVPLVGISISEDQKPNLLRAEKNGFAIMLSLQTVAKEELVSAIKRAMTDTDMRVSIQTMHNLFTDYSEQTPTERAINAVEYVIKHKGTDFLKPIATMRLPWYQQRGIGIFAFVVVVTFAFTFLMSKFFVF